MNHSHRAAPYANADAPLGLSEQRHIGLTAILIPPIVGRCPTLMRTPRWGYRNNATSA
ncbi:MAG: hypothetical protein LBT48_07820 [Prevotellaceae bacterium]|nr:hypothetical protein [Prevotellaceae bacterium]